MFGITHTFHAVELVVVNITGVTAIPIEHTTKDFHCFNITQADIIQTPALFVATDRTKTTKQRFTGDYKVYVHYPRH